MCGDVCGSVGEVYVCWGVCVGVGVGDGECERVGERERVVGRERGV